MKYLLHVFVVDSNINDKKEVQSLLDYYMYNTLDECINQLVEYFDDLDLTEFSDNYKDFQRDYMKDRMDCPPIRFTIFDIENKKFITKVKIGDVYRKFIDRLMEDDISDNLEKNMSI